MIFNSFEFLIFFPIVTTLYFLLPHKYRWIHLLISSCVFYMAFIPAYLLILAFIIIVDYAAALLMERSSSKKQRRYFLMLSLVANLGILVVFKYYNFLIANISSVFSGVNSQSSLIYSRLVLPIGLSFHTFQAMSYTLEVYRGNYRAEKNLGIYALYVMFYPQLVAGPIERPQNLIHQFYKKNSFSITRLTQGLRLMLWGFFKKVVVADRLAIYVNMVYDSPEQYHGASVLLATYFFAIQIYCDFSGYSDIAIGAAHVMGVKLMKNFDYPYSAASIQEFWRRWHISLSTWFRDYVYIPLGGNRLGIMRTAANLLIVFLLSGLWHGANWTFVVWGLLHGIYILIAVLKSHFFPSKNPDTAWKRFLKVIAVFHLVCFAWIFFRAGSLNDAWTVIKNLIPTMPGLRINILDERHEVALCLLAVLSLFIIEYLKSQKKITERFHAMPVFFRWGCYWVLIFYVLQFGYFHGTKEFIYFQF